MHYGDRCPGCESDADTTTDSEGLCAVCGMSLNADILDGGFVPEPTDPRNLRGRTTGRCNPLGSEMGLDGPEQFDRRYRRLARLNLWMTRVRPLFVDGVVNQLFSTGEAERTVERAARLIDEASSKEPLHAKRPSLRGYAGMTAQQERTEYRQRLYATAVLSHMNETESPNRCKQIAAGWGIDKYDLINSISMFGRLVPADPFHKTDSYVVHRASKLDNALTVIQDHLEGIADYRLAAEIAEFARKILCEGGEPLSYDDPMFVGRFSNFVADKSAMIAVVESMAFFGLKHADARELHDRFPVYGMSDYLAGIGPIFDSSNLTRAP